MQNLPIALIAVTWLDLRSCDQSESVEHIVVHEGDYIDATLDRLHECVVKDPGWEIQARVQWYTEADKPTGTPTYWKRVTLGESVETVELDYSGVPYGEGVHITSLPGTTRFLVPHG